MRKIVDNHLIEEAAQLEGNIVRNVLLCGPLSKNGRKYSENCLKKLAGLYKGVSIYANHDNRTVEGRTGTILTSRYCPEGVRGDIELLETAEITPKVKEAVVKNVPNIGFSHSISGSIKKGVVEDVEKVFSVDIVSEPATTSTFFEQYNEEDDDFEAMVERLEGLETQNKSLSEAIETFKPLEEAVKELKSQLEVLKEENEGLKRKLKVKEIVAPSANISHRPIDINEIVKSIRSN